MQLRVNITGCIELVIVVLNVCIRKHYSIYILEVLQPHLQLDRKASSFENAITNVLHSIGEIPNAYQIEQSNRVWGRAAHHIKGVFT
jgi:hypothetical protein